MESRKTVLMKLFAGQQWRRRYREQTYVHGVVGRKETVRCMERVTWKLNDTKCKIANGNLLYVSGNSNRDSVTI